MNLFEQAKRKAPPLHYYEREFMCSVDGDLHDESAFDVDGDGRDHMCSECRAEEVKRDREEDNQATEHQQAETL